MTWIQIQVCLSSAHQLLNLMSIIISKVPCYQLFTYFRDNSSSTHLNVSSPHMWHWVVLLLTLLLLFVTTQLLDLMHTLHTRAANIYSSWAEEQRHLQAAGRKIEADSQTLWTSCWCPLLQGTQEVQCTSCCSKHPHHSYISLCRALYYSYIISNKIMQGHYMIQYKCISRIW